MTSWNVKMDASWWINVQDKQLEDLLVKLAALKPAGFTVEMSKPAEAPKTEPVPDADGDIRCPDDNRVFASKQAYAVHRTRAHKAVTP